jgi:hypothetical protein
MEIFPEELEGAQRFDAEYRQYRRELRVWCLPGLLAGIFLLVSFIPIALVGGDYGLGKLWAFVFFFVFAPGFVAACIGRVKADYKYRHLDPTAGDPLREAAKAAAVTVAGAVAGAYVLHKLDHRNRP